MGAGFWIRRFFTVFAFAFVILLGAYLLRGRPSRVAFGQAALWAAISSVVFLVARIVQSRRGVHCAICKDTPEMQVKP